MRRILAVLFACATVQAPQSAASADHLVGPATAQERLAATTTDRARDLQNIESALSSPAAASVASALGVRIERLKVGVRALSDRELRDLALRAATLEKDPVAGTLSDGEVHDLLVIFLIVAIVILVFQAVN